MIELNIYATHFYLFGFGGNDPDGILQSEHMADAEASPFGPSIQKPSYALHSLS
jgi:hypothetical protein